MTTLSLEPTDDRANPVFKDEASCKKWLSQLQLTNLQQAHSLLLTQLDEFNRYPMRDSERLNTLELLRETIGHVQNNYTQKIIGKLLPLNENELITFFAIVQLWHTMSYGYQRCLQACIAGDKQLGNQAAFLCQRILMYCGLAITEHLRIGYEFDQKLWLRLHDVYAYAEEQELLFKKVPAPLNKTSGTCHGSYFNILLACYARPTQLTRSQLQLLEIWLPQWAELLSVQRSYITSKEGAQPLAFDLSSSQGLQPARAVKHGENMRYLDITPLSKLLRVKVILLQQGKTPKQVELGEFGSSQECIKMLTFLHQCWCEETDMRSGLHNQTARRVYLCHRPESIYAHLSGKPFRPPKQTAENDSAARKQIETFGHVLQNTTDKSGIKMEHPLETWLLEYEDMLGAQITREATSGGRLSNNQLVALRPSDTETFVLGATTKASMMRTGQLHIGVRFLTGTVHAVILHTNDADMGQSEKSAPAFLLQTSAALKTPDSLIIPLNWFKPGRVMDIQYQNGKKQHAKVGFSVGRGIDYERISFTLT